MNVTTDDLGGIQYLAKNAGVYVPYTIFNIIGVIIGCSGS
jgi:hypothetical protein